MGTGARPKGVRGVTLGLGAVLAFSAPALAQTFDRGQALYENHCQSCHESWAHERQGREAASIEAIRKRVAAWSLHSGLDWSDEEVDDVVDFLNRRFYHFGE